MPLDGDSCYRALVARDERFDGLFFVAVRTTGIYCRPVCRARTPGRDRCRFYRTGAEAERDGFRACWRCRPELAPGAARIDSLSRIVAGAVTRIDAGALNDGTLEELAQSLGVTGRHLRRATRAELGIAPITLAQSRRLALAKQLLHDTSLSMTDIAFASGFRSVRRFNSVFRATFGRPPSGLRRVAKNGATAETVTLLLDYRPPYDWKAILRFLAARAVPGLELVNGVESANGGSYLRTIRLGRHRGWVAVSPMAQRSALRAEVSLSLAPALMPVVARLRRLFDLDAQPRTIAAHLEQDAKLARLVRLRPGLRVPGAFEPFEAVLRAVLGQQVSVPAATTLYGRLVRTLGERIETPHVELTHLGPLPADVAAATEQMLPSLGVLPSRARTLRLVAEQVNAGYLKLDPNEDAESVVSQLEALPGLGSWTASYVAMRALGWPDAFPDGDLGIRKALGGISARQARALAERWRPWRAYAVMQLWTGVS